jgi:Lon protease-like protein
MSETIVTPIFPLPNLVFFPRGLLPLHIFEPRYIEMTADAIEGTGVIGMAQLRPRWEANYEGSPPIYDVGALGKIVRHEKLESGRYNILLYGVKRIQILEELDPEDKRYRRARVSFVESTLSEGSESDLEAAKNRLLALCHRLMEIRPEFGKTLNTLLSEHQRPDSFSDLIAGFLSSSFSIGAYERQCILEEPDIARRLQLINVQAGRVVGELIDGAM